MAAVQSFRLLIATGLRPATQRQQRVIRNAAQRRAQHRGQRQLVRRVVEKTQQLNQVSDLFALVKSFSLNREIRNSGAAQRAFVNPNAGQRAEKDRDVAVLEWSAGILPAFWSAHQRLNPFDQLLGIALTHAW